MQRGGIIATLLACAVLSACGDTVGKQSLYGAAGGAVVSEALGGDWAAGALMGAAANVLACDTAARPCN